MNKSLNKKAVLYCRVSTKEQVEEGNSLVTQERICREYATKNNYEVVHAFIEQGESAKTAERTQLQNLLKFCAQKSNGIKVVISYKIDRISRNTDDYSQIRLLLKKYGVEIKSTSEYFENTPVGRFLENTMANIAQFDNDIRTERCLGGMKEAVREGRYVWKAPIGYRNTKILGKANIEPDPLTAKLVKEAFLRVAQNNCPIFEVYIDSVKSGLVIQSSQKLTKSWFYKLLREPLYYGKIYKFGEIHDGKFEPIISKELFEQVQRVISKSSQINRTHILNNPDFPLRRFIRDEENRLATGSWSVGKLKRKYPYYRFGRNGRNVSQKTIHKDFIDLLNHYSFPPELVEKLIKKTEEEYDQINLATIQKRKELEKEIENLKVKQNKLIEKNLSGILSDKLLETQLNYIELDLQKKYEELYSLPNNLDNKIRINPIVKEYLINPGKTWAKLKIETQIKIQEFQFKEGLVYGKNGFETPKMSSFFKANSFISCYKSPRVDYPFNFSNNSQEQKSKQCSRFKNNFKIHLHQFSGLIEGVEDG